MAVLLLVETSTMSERSQGTMGRLILVLVLLWSTAAFPTTVYKTVDENGVVSFSDSNPEGEEEAEVLKISTPPPQATQDYQENLEAMRETTDRMAADRREREKHRAELKEVAPKPQPSSPQAGYHDSYPGYYGGGYYYPPGRPSWRPDKPSVPGYPSINPPLRPGASVYRGSNSQLMRPMHSRGR